MPRALGRIFQEVHNSVCKGPKTEESKQETGRSDEVGEVDSARRSLINSGNR